MSPADSGQVVHLELHTAGLPKARAFYARLFGWPQQRIDTPAGSYLAVDLSPTLGGGMVQCPTPRALWLPYVEVEDVWQTTQRAQQLGAQVMLSPREGPSGWRSVVSTPSAGEIAFWEPKR